jgi:hypothetical protein
MKPQMILTVFIISALAVFTAENTFSAGALKQFGDHMGRSHHALLYKRQACDSCHENSEPTAFPADFVCLDCHDEVELVQATARLEDEKWQNPHNNMHYGKDVPCMECHGEHRESELLCAGCHSFDYPDFKK